MWVSKCFLEELALEGQQEEREGKERGHSVDIMSKVSHGCIDHCHPHPHRK
jgi:hypothetical protein